MMRPHTKPAFTLCPCHVTPTPPPALQPWHRQASTDWYRLQGIDRAMLGAQQLYLAGSEGLMLADSYHCSRYNVNTGVLTEAMFHQVIEKIRAIL